MPYHKWGLALSTSPPLFSSQSPPPSFGWTVFVQIIDRKQCSDLFRIFLEILPFFFYDNFEYGICIDHPFVLCLLFFDLKVYEINFSLFCDFFFFFFFCIRTFASQAVLLYIYGTTHSLGDVVHERYIQLTSFFLSLSFSLPPRTPSARNSAQAGSRGICTRVCCSVYTHIPTS